MSEMVDTLEEARKLEQEIEQEGGHAVTSRYGDKFLVENYPELADEPVMTEEEAEQTRELQMAVSNPNVSLREVGERHQRQPAGGSR